MAERLGEAPVARPPSTRLDPWWLVQTLWWGLFLLLFLLVVRGPAWRVVGELGTGNVAGWLDLAIVVVLVALLCALFALGAAALERLRGLLARGAEQAAAAAGDDANAASRRRTAHAFPAPVTLATGGWLFFATLGVTVAMVVVIAAPDWLTAALGPDERIADLLVTMFAGAVGGSVSAIIAYLKHACEKGDFDIAYVPWYLARPLLGLLLGAITYFLVKGGLLLTVPSTAGEDFNDFGIAAVGTLVGLFSKNALEKLREVFHVIFLSREEAERNAKGENGTGEGRSSGDPQEGN